MTIAGLGHNKGPTLERGASWRRYAWTRARSELLPTLPIEVARRRVRRARELGLDYKAYAGIRASTGRDIVALLFSTGLLRPADSGRRLTPVTTAPSSWTRRWARRRPMKPVAPVIRIRFPRKDIATILAETS